MTMILFPNVFKRGVPSWTIWFVDTLSIMHDATLQKKLLPLFAVSFKIRRMHLYMDEESINCWKKGKFYCICIYSKCKEMQKRRCIHKKIKKKYYINVLVLVDALGKKKHFFLSNTWACIVYVCVCGRIQWCEYKWIYYTGYR